MMSTEQLGIGPVPSGRGSAAVQSLPASAHCQRWTEGRASWRHTSEGGFDRTRYEVAPLDQPTAKAYVLRHHYSGSFPADRLRYGIWDRAGELLGVAVLSTPVTNGVLTKPFPDLAPSYESLELGRLVLADAVPANAESWFLARVWEYAYTAGIRGVVSFSDPLPRRNRDGAVVMPGHVGTIYQASNAAYTGRATPRTLKVLPDGTVLNDRAQQKVRAQEQGHEYVERQLVLAGARPRADGEDPTAWLRAATATARLGRVRHHGNHRYLFGLGREGRRLLARSPLVRSAYPKLVDQAA